MHSESKPKGWKTVNKLKRNLEKSFNLFDELDVMLVDQDHHDLCLDLVAFLDGLHHDEVAPLDPNVFAKLGWHWNLKK